jgi:hypothetical protein
LFPNLPASELAGYYRSSRFAGLSKCSGGAAGLHEPNKIAVGTTTFDFAAPPICNNPNL